MMETEVLSIRHYKAGYEVRTEKVSMEDCPEVIMKSAYNLEGDYIGSSVWAYRCVVKRGIKPEKSDPTHNVCSIGFCEREQKWAGWSHRAWALFGVGDIVEKGDCAAESGWTDEWLQEHEEDDLSLPVGFEAKTLEDAKRIAIAFAACVS